MIIRAAYVGVILIWTTTPLAIQWSSQGGGYLFGITTRMLIGLCVLHALFRLAKWPHNRTPKAMLVYAISGLGIFGSMLSVYWGAQYIPSGWIALVFGLSPIITSILSSFLLVEIKVSPLRMLGIASALSGLVVIFGTSSQFSLHALWGLAAVLFSTISHSLSAVLVKRINAPVSGVEATYGGLTLAVPLFLITLFTAAFTSGQPLLVELPLSAWMSIVYLGVIATALGFSLYYYILKNLDAIRVSMITLITPVAALLLGAFLNDEPLTVPILLGTTLVVFGLAMFEFEKFMCVFFSRCSKTEPR